MSIKKEMDLCMPRLVCTKDGHCTIVHCDNQAYVLNFRLDTSSIDEHTFRYKPRYLKTRRLGSGLKLSHNEKKDHRHRLPEIWDQGKIGSCTAQCLAATLMLCMKDKHKFTPSRLFIYYCSRALGGCPAHEDSGCSMKNACDSIIKYGFCSEELMPYRDDDDSFKKLPSATAFAEALKRRNYVYEALSIKLEDMISCIDDGLCFVIGIAVYESLFNSEVIKSGDIPMPKTEKEQLLGGHAITICGYDRAKRVFHVRNSWGTKWGDQGYGTIPFEYLTHPRLAIDPFVLRCKPHH